MNSSFNEKKSRLIQETGEKLTNISKKFVSFNSIHFFIFLIEIISLFLCPFFKKNILFSAIIAITILTIFVYLTLLSFFLVKKNEQIFLLKQNFIASYVSTNSHLFAHRKLQSNLVQLICIFIHRLEKKEYNNIYLFKKLHISNTTIPWLHRFNIECHWKDRLLMKEFLYYHSIQIQLQWIKEEPVNNELHTILASSFISLYRIYNPVKNLSKSIEKKSQSVDRARKFKKFAHCALEELKVALINNPKDLWTLSRIASVYRDLGLHEEEKQTYDMLLEFMPENEEVLFRLGILYFQQGSIANGLKTYEALKKKYDPKAEILIEKYVNYFDPESKNRR